MRLIMHDAWLAEGTQRFGSNPLDWRFVCPSCGHVASVRDWSDAGAEPDEIAMVCIGTRKNAAHGATLRASGGPCHYRGDGLFALNSVRVVFNDRAGFIDLFEFFTPPRRPEIAPAAPADPPP